MAKKDMAKAKNTKRDEFYTSLTDIEKEVKMYKSYFTDKVVFCNCDDPQYSNFFKYFYLNFHFLGLKRLITTHYNKDGNSYKLEVVRLEELNEQTALPDIIETPLEGNGDFRSEECLEVLKEADVVVTNPPYSLFREFVDHLIEYDKKFLILGNQNSVTYKNIYPLVKENKIWYGYNNGGTKWFKVPNDYEIKTKNRTKIIDGEKYISMGNVNWYTNLDTTKRHERFVLVEKYSPDKYPKYENYDAIEVSNVVNIPRDYDGEMGVPITFVDKYNPEQFEIIRFRKGDDGKDLRVNGKDLFFRVIIKKR